ncbi:DUF2274 domain-containing protein [Pararhizobium sp. LjRoot255]|uniref:DUF2274 domain-containing protein n=1 Tax=Pararhizobium sp. LjRoot255 TaxID=3342298 RepID=UPI003ED12CD0
MRPERSYQRRSLELPAQLNRDLTAYAEVLAARPGSQSRPRSPDRAYAGASIATDRGFAKARRTSI